MNQGIVITAGYDKAKNVIAVSELLRREGKKIKAVIVVNPYSIKRLKSLVRQRGKGSVKEALKKMYSSGNGHSTPDPLDEFLKANKIKFTSLKKWCRTCGVDYLTVKTLNDKKPVNVLKKIKPEWVVYGGGGILKDDFISAANGRVLNAHSGPMPEIRGMNACEWSLLLCYNPAVTIHLIDRGIDTGGIIKKIPVPVKNNDSIDTLRNKCIVEGIKGITEVIKSSLRELPRPEKNSSHHRQCFVLAPALRELLEKKLEVRFNKTYEGSVI